LAKNNISKGVGRETERSDTKQRLMKRYGNLYQKISNMDNLCLAYEKARKGKVKAKSVKSFEKNLNENMMQIQSELTNESYKTSEYSVFMIHDPKERQIYRLPFKDRVVHHAIMNVLEPIWTSIFISHTYSCIKNKGVHGALKHIKRDLKNENNTVYCLKIDVKKFYPSIDHDILKNIIRKKIKDVQLLRLLDGIIDSAPGLPIGNYLSQYMANLYLSYFDHWMKESKGISYYYRYADDIVILSDNKPHLHDLLNKIRMYLKDNLNLDLKGNEQIFPVESRGIDFVGYVFYHTHVYLRKSIKKNFCRKVALINKKEMPYKDYVQSICSYLGWAKHCNSRHLIKKIIQNETILGLWD
jgi:retron-type reverse transcriptase